MNIIIFYKEYEDKFYMHFNLTDISGVGDAINKFIEKIPPQYEDYNDIVIRFV